MNPRARVFLSGAGGCYFHCWDDACILSVAHSMVFFSSTKLVGILVMMFSASVISCVLVPWKCLLFLCISLFTVGTWMQPIISKIAIGSASNIETSLSCCGVLGCIAEPALAQDLETGSCLIWVTVWIVLCKTLHVVSKRQRIFPAEENNFALLYQWSREWIRGFSYPQGSLSIMPHSSSHTRWACSLLLHWTLFSTVFPKK